MPERSGLSGPTAKQRLGALDAWNLTVQRQVGQTVSVELGYVGNKGTHVFFGDGPDIDANAPTIVGFGTLSANQRRPYFAGPVTGIDGAPWGRPTAGRSRSLPLPVRRQPLRRSRRGWRAGSRTAGAPQALYPPVDPQLQLDGNRCSSARSLGHPGWSRKHVFQVLTTYEIPLWRRNRWLGGWQVNAVGVVMSGLPFNVTYRDAGADRDVGPDLIGDPKVGSGNGIDAPYFNATPIGTPGNAFGRPARGTFGNLERSAFRGPSFWDVDASLFKRFRLVGASDLEFRLEVQNVFNHVNHGLPDAQVGVPGNDNPRAGFINGVDASWVPRNLQFGFRLIF